MSPKSDKKVRLRQAAPTGPISQTHPTASPAPANLPQTPPLSVFATILDHLFVSTLVVLSFAISPLSLSPVYGSYPAKRYHDDLIFGFFILESILSRLGSRCLHHLKMSLPIAAFWIPVVQAVLFKQSAALGPVYGPLVTEMCTVGPFISLVALYNRTILEFYFSKGNSTASTNAGILCSMTFYGLLTLITRVLPSIFALSPHLTSTSLQLLIATACAVRFSSVKSLIFVLPAIVYTIGFNPHLFTPLTTARLNTELAAHGYKLLDRQESITGYVSVVEAENDFRALRCDHSLLGGQFLLNPEREKLGMVENETIYAVFTMLEAVRLVEVPNSRRDEDSSALVIGLGIGTCPAALINLGINTTIVEIDPVVHDFAIRHFGFPKNHTAVLNDAVEFVAQRAADPGVAKYDYIIHDVFTGGVEPSALFTFDFITGLDAILSDTGVIAINYASHISAYSTKLVMKTIFSVFPTCRVYRETSDDIDEAETFANMVVFCTKQAGRPLTFRPPEPADWGKSLSRSQFIPPKDEWEINSAFFKGEDEEIPLLRAGNKDVIDRHALNITTSHWHIMRTVMPDIVWELW